MDTPKTSNPAMSAGDSGGLVIGNVLSLAGAEDARFMDRTKTKQSGNNLTTMDNIKAEFVDVPNDFLSQVDLKAEPIDPLDIKNLQLGSLINASNPGGWSSGAFAVKHEPGQHSRELTNCLIPKVEPKVEGAFHFQTVGHLQSFPKLIKGEIPDCICEPGEVNFRSNVGERLSLFELMSQSRDQNHLPNDNHMLQPKERNPVNPDLKRSVHDSMSLEPSQMLLPTHSKSSEGIPESMALQQKQKPNLQCARKSTISMKVKENRSRTKPVNKDTDLSSHGIDEDTDGYQIDSGSDSDVSQGQLGSKNPGNNDGVADVETEKKQTESVPTIPSKSRTNQLKNKKRGKKGSKASTKQPKTADNNNEHIPEQILTISVAKINGRSLNEDVINPTQTDQSYQNRSTRSFRHLDSEKQPEQDGREVGVESDSATKTVGRSRKSRSKQKPETADANSNSPARRTTRSLRKSEHRRQMDQSDLEEDVDQNETFARQTRSSGRKATLTQSRISKKKTTEDQTSDSEDQREIDSVTPIRQTKRSTAKQKFPRMERRGSVTSDTEKDVSQSESESQTRHTARSSTSKKRTNSRQIRTGKRKQVDTSASGNSGSESSSDSDAKRVGRETPTRRKRKRRKLLPERSSSLNSESATETESNDAEAKKKNLRQHKKRKRNDYTPSVSDSENDNNPDSDFESQHGESKSRKLKKGSRKPRLKGQRSNDRSESDSESLPSKQIGPHKVKSSSLRLGRKARSSEDSELSDDRNTGSESDDTLTNQSDSRSSRKRNSGRHVSKGKTTDCCDSSENDSDSDDTNRSEQVSLRSKRNTSGPKRPKQKDSSDSSEDEKASRLNVSDSVEMLSDDESKGTITASPGCSLEEKYAGDVRFQPFVQLEPLPDILEMKQLPPRTPVTRKVKNNIQNSNRKSNSSKKKGAETLDVVELVDIDDGGSDIVGQSNNNKVNYEAQTPQVQDEELEFLTAASYGIYSSRARRLAAMRLANFSMTSKRKKKQTSNTKSPVITLSEGSEWEGSEVGDSVQSEETNDSQCGATKEMSQSNDPDKNNIESKDRVSVETAKADTTINQFPVKSKWAKVRTTCRVCMEEFASNTTYFKHFQTAHPGMKPFICKVCGKGFERRDGLKSHVSVHTDERPCVCKLCGKTYKHSAHLHEHTIRCHSGKLNFICSYCGVGYISNYKLNIHVRIHTGEKPYECEICHKRFAQKSTLDSHSAVHSAERPFICQHCGKGYKAKNLLNVHMATHSDVRNYKCKICPLAFKWQQSLRDHMQNHNDERNFPCEICNFSFRRKRQLQQHMYIHSEERQFSCDICSKKFRTKKSLTTHMLIHVGEKKFECDLCHKRFYTNSHLKKHKFLHTGKRPYACKICDQRFKTTGGVSQHMMCVHPEEEMERRKTNAVGWVVVDP